MKYLVKYQYVSTLVHRSIITAQFCLLIFLIALFPKSQRSSLRLRLRSSTLKKILRNVKVLDVFAEVGMVATRILYDGVHTGTCMGIPATGKHISFEALENLKVENGKIVESWGYWPDKEIEQKLLKDNF